MRRTSKPKKGNQKERATPYRSGLEDTTVLELTARKVPFKYESFKVGYTVPERRAKYTPDFLLLDNGIIVETKGLFETADRQKHLLIQKEHPDLDIRFVFSRSKTTIGKKSKTTYAMWCEKNDFLYADKHVPQSWVDEPPLQSRFDAIKKATVCTS